jgi:dUTP pyrophosphatase
VLNAPGTIDSGYRGEVGVILFNAGAEDVRIDRGDRVAQMVVQTLPEVELVAADELTATERGDGGFGSTGQN